MKRSGDVTASAIILFVGSGLMVLMAVVIIVSAAVTPLPAEQRAVEFMMPIFYTLLAAWGIATGVGVLRLRPWARISMIVMSSVAIFVTVCGALGIMMVPLLLQQEPGVPVAAIKVVVLVGLIMMAVPLAIAIWWLILFTRKRVQLEFATRGASVVSSAVPGGTPAPDPASGFAPASASAPSAPQIPISIRVIAIIEVATAPFGLVTLPIIIRMHAPVLIVGVLVHGWIVSTFLLAMIAAQMFFSIAILRRNKWGVDGLIGYALFGLLNTLLFYVSRSRAAYEAATVHNVTMPPNMSVDSMLRFQHWFLGVVFGFTAAMMIAGLYFLFTRRKAFRAACEAPR